MDRRTLTIIVVALVFVAVVLSAWFWLFSKGTSVGGSLFGSSGNRASTTTASGQGTNLAQGLPSGSNTASQGGILSGNGSTNVPLGGTSGVPASSGTGSFIGSSVGIATTSGVGDVSGVNWLGGSGAGGASGAPITSFTPSTVNQLNSGTQGGQVSIFGSGGGTLNTSPDSQFGALFAAAGIGTALCTAGLLGGGPLGGLVGLAGGPAISTGVDAAAVPVRATGVVLQQSVSNTIAGSQAFKADFLDCITRTIGRAIVNQITASVVNWINGGFKGSPSFVTNYQQFFANVADQAAGAYIQGSALAFLCSPFQLQVKIAIAQSYANRNARSCSLTGVTQNINRFMAGNFNSGGWPALLSFTSVPTNNPYGAFAYGQIGLATAQQQALNNANKSITPGGFISFAQTYNCNSSAAAQNGQLVNNSSLFLSPAQAASGVKVPGCDTKIVTPGQIIESELSSTINGSGDMLRQLGISGSFDAILSALITQLMTKTLQSGLSNLSGTNGYAGNYLTPDQQQAQSQGNQLLTTLQQAEQVAQQYGGTEQGSITDLQNSQNLLSKAANCWESIETDSSFSSAQQAQAAQQASSTQLTIAALQAQVNQHNSNITKANASIAILEGLQSQTLAVTSTGDVKTITNNFSQALATGQLITTNDVTLAQQNRTTLQSQLASVNAQANTSANQCQAAVPSQWSLSLP